MCNINIFSKLSSLTLVLILILLIIFICYPDINYVIDKNFIKTDNQNGDIVLSVQEKYMDITNYMLNSLPNEYKDGIKHISQSCTKFDYTLMTGSIDDSKNMSGVTIIEDDNIKINILINDNSVDEVFTQKRPINKEDLNMILYTFMLAHELRHVYQHNTNKYDLKNNYIKYNEDNFDDYFEQDAEVDANEFSNNFLKEHSSELCEMFGIKNGVISIKLNVEN